MWYPTRQILANVLVEIRDDALINGVAAFGITNLSTTRGAFACSIGISYDVSVFFDDLHPSARAHQLIGQSALALLGDPIPVPEPSRSPDFCRPGSRC